MTIMKSKILKIITLILAINIYTFSIDKLQFSYLAFYLIVLLALVFLYSKNITISKVEIIVAIVPIFYLFFTLLYTNDFYSGFKFTAFFTVFILIQLILKDRNEWHSIFYKAILVFSFIFVVFTFYQYLLPSHYISTILPLFNSNQQLDILKLMRKNSYTGLTSQNAPNAFLISIGFGVLFCKLLYNKKSNKLFYVFAFIYIIAILMTMKRSFIVANVFCIVAMFFVEIKFSNRKITLFIKYFIVIIAFLTFLVMSGLFQSIINVVVEKFIFTEFRDFTSGRNNIYIAGFDMFAKSPLIGHGIYSTPSILASRYNMSGIQQMHNIYLQFLAELGIIGTIIFVFLIILFYYKTYKNLKRIYKGDNIETKIIIGSSFYIQNLWIIYGFFGNPFTENTYLLFYMLVISISIYYSKSFQIVS